MRARSDVMAAVPASVAPTDFGPDTAVVSAPVSFQQAFERSIKRRIRTVVGLTLGIDLLLLAVVVIFWIVGYPSAPDGTGWFVYVWFGLLVLRIVLEILALVLPVRIPLDTPRYCLSASPWFQLRSLRFSPVLYTLVIVFYISFFVVLGTFIADIVNAIVIASGGGAVPGRLIITIIYSLIHAILVLVEAWLVLTQVGRAVVLRLERAEAIQARKGAAYTRVAPNVPTTASHTTNATFVSANMPRTSHHSRLKARSHEPPNNVRAAVNSLFGSSGS